MKRINRWIVKVMSAALLTACVPFAVAQNTPPSSAPGGTTLAEMEAQADSLRNQKDYARAAEAFRAALRKDPKNSALYNKLGLTELQLGSVNAAQGHFRKAMKYKPGFVPAINNIGVSAYLLKDYPVAAQYFKKALALNEGNPATHCNLGFTWFAMERYDRASAEFTRALELDPAAFEQATRSGVTAKISPESKAKYSFVLARLYARRGDVENALVALRRASEEGYPSMSEVYKEEDFALLRQDARLAAIVPRKR